MKNLTEKIDEKESASKGLLNLAGVAGMIVGGGLALGVAFAGGSYYISSIEADFMARYQDNPKNCYSPISEKEEIRRFKKFGYDYCLKNK